MESLLVKTVPLGHVGRGFRNGTSVDVGFDDLL